MIEREGWGLDTDGTRVHLASEMGVMLDDYHGDWVIIDVDDARWGLFYQTAEDAMDVVDASYAADPRHALEW